MVKPTAKEKYIYRDNDGDVRFAYFNMENGTFKIHINKSYLSKPNIPRDFSIKIQDDEGTEIFNELITIP